MNIFFMCYNKNCIEVIYCNMSFRLDTFLLDIKKKIGRIKKASIRHDNSWLGPGWYLEKVLAHIYFLVFSKLCCFVNALFCEFPFHSTTIRNV